MDQIRPHERALINDSLEFFRIHLSGNKRVYMGIGQGDNIVEAMEQALSCSLLKDSLHSEVESLLVSIVPSEQTTLDEVETVCDLMKKNYGERIKVLWGLVEAADRPVVVLYVITI